MASAILFGSIGTLAETSDMQRRAFNLAFAEAGLNWHWEGPAYTEMLKRSGGRGRIARSAAGRGEEVDAGAIHAAKSRIFRDMLAAEGATPRPGVSDVVSAASLADVPLAFATSTDRSNVDALLAALTTTIPSSVFATILDRSQVDAGKPDPEVYARTLDRLGLALPVSASSRFPACITAATISERSRPSWTRFRRSSSASLHPASDRQVTADRRL